MEDKIKLMVKNEDFEGFVQVKPIHKSLEEKLLHGIGISEEEKKAQDDILSALPKVVARKVEKSTPKGFKLSTIQLTLEVSGEPFGIGVKSDVQLTFTKGKAGK